MASEVLKNGDRVTIYDTEYTYRDGVLRGWRPMDDLADALFPVRADGTVLSEYGVSEDGIVDCCGEPVGRIVDGEFVPDTLGREELPRAIRLAARRLGAEVSFVWAYWKTGGIWEGATVESLADELVARWQKQQAALKKQLPRIVSDYP